MPIDPGIDAAERHELERRVRVMVDAGETTAAVKEALRVLSPEVLGFLSGVLGSDQDADEVFAVVSERLWRSLPTFEWRCSLRTWTYVIARREATRFRRGARRHAAGRERISGFAEVIPAREETRSTRGSLRRQKLKLLRDELPEEDRALLVLRVDRGLEWEEIALTFVESPETCSDEERKREAARLRKRFQLVRQRLAQRVREEGLLGPQSSR